MTNPEPVIVKFTLVFAGAVFGVMLRIVGCGVGVTATVGGAGEVEVAVGTGTVGEGGAAVTVGREVKVGTVAVGETGVTVDVGEGGTGVGSVGEGRGEAVGVITMGLPNSLHPRSGAAPTNPVSGLGGMGSPLTARY